MKKNDKVVFKEIEEADIKLSLPNNFYQELLGFENEFMRNKSIKVIEKLVLLYKVGAEFYSGLCVEKQKYFSIRLQDLFLNKGSIMVVEDYNIDLPKRMNTNNFYKNQQIQESENDDKIKLALRKSKSFNSKYNINYRFLKRKSIHTTKNIFLTDNNKLNQSIQVDVTKLVIKETDINEELKIINEAMNSYKAKIDNFQKLVDESMKFQILIFKDRFENHKKNKKVLFLEIKRRENSQRNSDSFSSYPEFQSFLNRERKISDEHRRSSQKDVKIENGLTQTFNLSLKTQSKFIKMKGLTVNEVFKDFSNKFHYIYFQKIYEIHSNKIIPLLNENYNKKIEEYFKIEDHIKELNIMFSDDMSNEQFFNMTVQLEDQRNQVLKRLDGKFISDIDNIQKILKINNNSNFEGKLSKIIDDLINNLINILK